VLFVFSFVFIFSMAFKLASLVFLAAKRKSRSAAASRGKTVLMDKSTFNILFKFILVAL